MGWKMYWSSSALYFAKCIRSGRHKAGSASEATRLTPRPPSLTGRLACNHWEGTYFVIPGYAGIPEYAILYQTVLTATFISYGRPVARGWGVLGVLKTHPPLISKCNFLTDFNLSLCEKR